MNTSPLRLFTTPPKCLCVVRLSALGDCCNALGCILAIQKAWPKTEITWIVAPVQSDLIRLYPSINVIVFDKKQGVKAYVWLWKQLKHIKFDAILNLQTSIRASFLTLGLRYHFHLGYDAQRAREGQAWFTNIKVPSPQSAHVVDGFLAFAHTLGLPRLEPLWQAPTLAHEQAWADHYLQHKTSIIMTLGSSKAQKDWLPEFYAQMADYLTRQGFFVVLCGSRSVREQKLAKAVQKHCQEPVENLVGSTTLRQLIALIKSAYAFIGPDSGPLHLANLCGTPAIGLHAVHPACRTGAYRYLSHAVCVYDKLKKRTRNHKWRSPITDPKAMASIDPVDVQSAFECLNRTYLKQKECKCDPKDNARGCLNC